MAFPMAQRGCHFRSGSLEIYVVGIMRQRIRRQQDDADSLQSNSPSPFVRSPQTDSDIDNRPTTPIQAKSQQPLHPPFNPRRFDQIPLFPTPGSVPVQRKATVTNPTPNPVQRQVIQQIQSQERQREEPSQARSLTEDSPQTWGQQGVKQAIALSSPPPIRPPSSTPGVQLQQELSSGRPQRWRSLLLQSPAKKTAASKGTNTPIQKRSIHRQPNSNGLKGIQANQVQPPSPTLPAKDFSQNSELEQYQSSRSSSLQLKTIAHPPVTLQRDQDKKTVAENGADDAGLTTDETGTVPTFTRESSLSSVDDTKNISFVPVSVDIDDEQNDMDDYSSDRNGSIFNQSGTDDLDMATISHEQLDAHMGNTRKGQRQNPNQSSGNVNFVGQNNSQSNSKDSLWKRFTQKMKRGKDKAKKGMQREGVNAARNVPLAAAQSFYVADGITSLQRINSASQGLDIVADGSMMGISMAQILEAILSTTWCSLCLGANLIKGFHYQKRRRKAYKNAWDATGFKEDKEGNVLAPLPESQHQNTIKLGRLAKYAYHKTNRAFWSTMFKCILQIVRLISYLITALTGGTTAVVTGAIALGSKITENVMSLGRKTKGIWKLLRGTKGKNRKKHADELLVLAHAGHQQAAQTIMDVNPFDELLMKGVSGGANAITKRLGMGISRKIGGKGNNWKVMTLPRPENADDLIQQLQKGGIYDKQKRTDPDGINRKDRLLAMLKAPATEEKFLALSQAEANSADSGTVTYDADSLFSEAQRGQKTQAQWIMKLWDETTWSTSDIPMPKPTGWKHLINELQANGLYSDSDTRAPMRRRKLANILKRSMLSQ